MTLIEMLKQFDHAIGAALPKLDPKERWRRLIYVTSLLFQVFMLEPFVRELDESFSLQGELEAARASLKSFALAGLSAAAPRRKRGRSA